VLTRLCWGGGGGVAVGAMGSFGSSPRALNNPHTGRPLHKTTTTDGLNRVYSARGPCPRPHKATWQTHCHPHSPMEIDVHALFPLQRPVGGISHDLGDARAALNCQAGYQGRTTLYPGTPTQHLTATPNPTRTPTNPTFCLCRPWVARPSQSPSPPHGQPRGQPVGAGAGAAGAAATAHAPTGKEGGGRVLFGCGLAPPGPPPPVCRPCAAPRAARPHRPCLWPAQPSYIRGPALPGMPVCTAGLADGVRACLRKTCKPDGFPWHKQGRGAARVPPAAHAPARFTYFVCDRARCPLRGVVRSGVRW
jgi:hypothetical protein